jgi:hypothetical protein
MEFRSVGGVYLLSTMIAALAALNTASLRVALAQIPEAPGDVETSQGLVEDPGVYSQEPGQRSRRGREGAKPKLAPPTPDAARDTIDELERARERAMGTPAPEPPPDWE